MPGISRQLTDAQAEHFLERGFVTVRGAFDVSDAQQWLDEIGRAHV